MSPLKQLPDGLLLRRGRPDDADQLAEFNIKWLSDDEREEHLGVWTRDVFTKPHPTFSPDLTTIVEDTRTGEIVSSVMLFPQTWSYAGIPFGVGRPELIATHPDYRKRGLVRLQMETVHQWSAELGHRVQAITGIPWFYRQFGYEMGLDGHGGRTTFSADMPGLKDGEAEVFRFRPAGLDDIPFIAAAYEGEVRRHLVACVKDRDDWVYEIAGRSSGNTVRTVIEIMTREDGQPVGFFGHPDRLWGKSLGLYFVALAPGASWLEITPPLIRRLYQVGGEYAAQEGDQSCESLLFSLGLGHPIFELFPYVFPRERKPYAWYVRVPDLPDFLALIRPLLEDRLAGSILAGFSEEVRLNFYRTGIRLGFDGGRIKTIQAWQPVEEDKGHARFPDLTFLSLLFGRRSFDELADFYPDCFAAKDEVRALLNILFPKQTSNVWGVV